MAGSHDMFDAIVMADERFHGEGYQEGYEEGSGLGMIEGRQYGTLHGAKIGSEIGCYQGFAFAWRCLLRGCATEKDRGRRLPCRQTYCRQTSSRSWKQQSQRTWGVGHFESLWIHPKDKQEDEGLRVVDWDDSEVPLRRPYLRQTSRRPGQDQGEI